MHQLAKQRVQRSKQMIDGILASDEVIDNLVMAAHLIVDAYACGGCLFVAGNGGSAADAQHLVAEFISKLNRDRDPIKAFALSVDTSILTAVGNDYGFEFVFSRQVEGLMEPDDVLLSITTSGDSKNIVEAMTACRKKGGRNILLSGMTGGQCDSLSDVSILIPTKVTSNIQEGHLVLYHILCELIEMKLEEKKLLHFR